MALNLPRLRRNETLFEKGGAASEQLRRNWQLLCEAIEANQAGDDVSRAAIAILDAPFSVRTLTASGAATADDYLLLVDATAGAVTVALPAAADSEGALIVVKKTDVSANTVTIDASGAETIDGAATEVLAAQYDALTVACDGTTWWIV